MFYRPDNYESVVNSFSNLYSFKDILDRLISIIRFKLGTFSKF